MTCNPHADDGIVFGPIPLVDYPYGANGWHLHYFDPLQYQIGRSGIKGREAAIVASPEYGSDYIKTSALGILCSGYLNLADWSAPAGDTSAASTLVAEGLLPVIDTPGPRTMTATVAIDLGASAIHPGYAVQATARSQIILLPSAAQSMEWGRYQADGTRRLMQLIWTLQPTTARIQDNSKS